MNSLENNLAKNSLNNIEKEITTVINWSLNEIKNNPEMEKQITANLVKQISHIGDFLLLEFDRTGNKEIYKKLIKSLIFR